MSRITRRRFVASVLVLPLLGACGGRSPSTTLPASRAGVQAATPDIPGVASVATVTASSRVVTATTTAFVPDFGRECQTRNDHSSPAPDDPFRYILHAEGEASTFADHVRYAPLIVLIDNSRFSPTRWTTADGRRPANPHVLNVFNQPQFMIITPQRAEVVEVAKGEYGLREIYFAHFGGEVGQDCASISDSLYLGGGPVGSRTLCLAKLAEYPEAAPVAGDPRYRFYTISRSYAVSPEGTITIGPERDIMGYKKDDPPRTITIDEALREIAVLDGRSGATPTPGR